MDDALDTDPPTRSRLPMGVIVPALALLVGAGGGFVANRMLGQAEASPPEAAAHGEAVAASVEEGAPGETAAVGAPGTASASITNLGTFTVNLRGSGGGRVLRLEVQVESPPGKAGAVEARLPQLRDSVITAVSDYTWSELEGTDGKTRLRDELLARLNGVVAPAVVERLYFTQFVVQ